MYSKAHVMLQKCWSSQKVLTQFSACVKNTYVAHRMCSQNNSKDVRDVLEKCHRMYVIWLENLEFSQNARCCWESPRRMFERHERRLECAQNAYLCSQGDKVLWVFRICLKCSHDSQKLFRDSSQILGNVNNVHLQCSKWREEAI